MKNKQEIANFIDSYIGAEDYRNLDDFETVLELCHEIENNFPLPFCFTTTTGEDAFIEVSFWSPELHQSIIIDCDWPHSFENASDFADEIEQSYKEYLKIASKIKAQYSYFDKLPEEDKDALINKAREELLEDNK